LNTLLFVGAENTDKILQQSSLAQKNIFSHKSISRLEDQLLHASTPQLVMPPL
jgi:hypothetical protein